MAWPMIGGSIAQPPSIRGEIQERRIPRGAIGPRFRLVGATISPDDF
jgi:hypothetical protein